MATSKVRDIPLLNMPLKEPTTLELRALPGRQVIDVDPDRTASPCNRCANACLQMSLKERVFLEL